MNAALLEVGGLTARYGQITALHSVELSVAPGEAVALVGANGAGKSTLMKCVMGMLAGASGVVRFAGNDLTQRPVSARARVSVSAMRRKGAASLRA